MFCSLVDHKLMLVDENYVNRRIDKYLRDNFGYLQGKICVLSKQKKILVNNEPKKFDYRLKENDNIRVLDDCFEQNINRYFHKQKEDTSCCCIKRENDEFYEGRKKCCITKNVVCKNKKQCVSCKNDNNEGFDEYEKYRNEIHREDLPIEMVFKLKQSIVFEDDNVIVINKPYGLSVQGGTGVKYSLEDYFPLLSDKKLRIVHRIDKDTRGLLVLAKNVKTAVKLTDMFKKRQVHKRYIAVLSGIPMKLSGTIKTYIVLSKKDNMAGNAHSFEERMNGKEAITKYKVLKTNDEKKISLVEFFPLTGRKHQIRLHSQYIKCPIVGDEKYGFVKQKNKKLQLFAVSIDASPVVKVDIDENSLQKMIDFD